MSSSARFRSLWWTSTPLTLAITGSGAGAWAGAAVVMPRKEAKHTAMPAARRAGQRRSTPVFAIEGKGWGGGAMYESLHAGMLAQIVNAGRPDDTRLIGSD